MPENPSNSTSRSLIIAISITFLMTIVEIVGGLFTNSLALLSDAGHMLVDTLGLSLSLFALKFSTKPATVKNTYGFYRLEILVALFNGVTLTLISLYIFYKVYKRFISPPVVKSLSMIFIATIGLIVNVLAGLIIYNDSNKNLNIKGAFLHIIGDALSSIGVIIGGLLMLWKSWYIADPVISTLIGLLILKGAWGLIKESIGILLESVPKGINVDSLVEEIKNISNAKEVHHMHFWTISSNVHALSVHLKVSNFTIRDTKKILDDIRKVLKDKYSVGHVTVQFECDECTEPDIT